MGEIDLMAALKKSLRNTAKCATCGKYLDMTADTTTSVFTPDSERGPERQDFHHIWCLSGEEQP